MAQWSFAVEILRGTAKAVCPASEGCLEANGTKPPCFASRMDIA